MSAIEWRAPCSDRCVEREKNSSWREPEIVDRIIKMDASSYHPLHVFRRIGATQWVQSLDAFVVETPLGAKLVLSSNADETVGCGVHIDEIEVPEHRGRMGAATAAMSSLCLVADELEFRLEGGPVGWSTCPWRNQFLGWLHRFGFEVDTRHTDIQLDDPLAYYVCRRPIAASRTP